MCDLAIQLLVWQGTSNPIESLTSVSGFSLPHAYLFVNLLSVGFWVHYIVHRTGFEL